MQKKKLTRLRKKLEEIHCGAKLLMQVLDRGSMLYTKGFYIAYILFKSQIIEYLIEEIIKLNEDIINLHLKKSMFKAMTLSVNKPLGYSKLNLERVLKDKSIIKDIEKFNKIRIEAMHRIIKSKQSIKKTEKEMKKYIDNEGEKTKLAERLLCIYLKATAEWIEQLIKNSKLKEKEKSVINEAILNFKNPEKYFKRKLNKK
ncbi:MAG: hypothetical protein ACKKMS_00265 [Candidatus Nealsonbacteria bacterium]